MAKQARTTYIVSSYLSSATLYNSNKEGKQTLLTELAEKFNKKIRYNNREITNFEKIRHDCHSIANKLIGKNK